MCVSEFSQWFEEQLRARGRAGSLSKIAEATGASKSTIANWASGDTNPTWHNCRGIASAFNVPRDEVRRLAGYRDPDDDPYIGEATLTPDEAALVNEYRKGNDQTRQSLLGLSELVRSFRTRLDAGEEGAAL